MRSLSIAGWLFVGLSLLGCSRSGLYTRGGSGAGGGSSSSTGAGGGGGMPVRPLCRYAPAGEALATVSLDDQHAISASHIQLQPGSDGTLAELAVQVLASGGNSPLHPGNLMIRMTVDQPWPDGVVMQPPSPYLVGIESHSYAQLARSSGDGSSMAMSWFSDLSGYGRVAFRSVQIANNEVGPVMDIDLQGQVAVAMAPGAAVGEFGVGHAGSGYGLVWRRYLIENESQQAFMGIVGNDGQLLLGPHPVTPQMDVSPSPAAVWTGERYVMATAYNNCPGSDPLCAGQSVVISRFRPASGDAFDDSGVEVVATIGSLSFESAPTRPMLAHHAGRTWLSWPEAGLQLPDAERVIRLVELAPDGTPLGEPLLLPQPIAPINQPTLVAGDQGLALVWQALTGDDGPPDQPGIAAIRVLALDHDGNPLAELVEVPITQPQGSIPSAVTLDSPRALLVTWSGTRIGGGLDQTFLARFDCLPVTP